jgi:hypothetical protein
VHYDTYETNCHRLQDYQLSLLKGYLQANAQTSYGQQWGFRDIGNYQAYRSEIPIIEDYEQLAPYMEKIAIGHADVLTQGEVQFFETTTGSTSLSKWIPYTTGLLQEFRTALGVWMYALSLEHPSAFDGMAFWSLSPKMKPTSTTLSGLQVGIDSDEAYLSQEDLTYLQHVLVNPEGLAEQSDSTGFYTCLLSALLGAQDLSYISVWSPSYLVNLHRYLVDNVHLIGKYRPDLVDPIGQELPLKTIFPNLAVVSCWADHLAGMWMPDLQKACGDVVYRPKGLLSTEGVVSIPYFNDQRLLAYTSHFYEFRAIGTGKILLATEVEVGGQYEVILTTGGGLYRYNTRDVVRVTTLERGIPTLEFMGRSDGHADLVGEKVTERHCLEIAAAMRDYLSQDVKLLFLPYKNGQKAMYVVMVAPADSIQLTTISQVIEQALCDNPYYQQARALDQLQHVKVVGWSSEQFMEGLQAYKRFYRIADGDTKLPILCRSDFADYFLQNLGDV